MEKETSKLESIERILFLTFRGKGPFSQKAGEPTTTCQNVFERCFITVPFISTLALWILNDSPLFPSWLPYSTVYLDFHLLCSMTKLKEHSREICYLFPWLNNKCRICDLVRHCLHWSSKCQLLQRCFTNPETNTPKGQYSMSCCKT